MKVLLSVMLILLLVSSIAFSQDRHKEGKSISGSAGFLRIFNKAFKNS